MILDCHVHVSAFDPSHGSMSTKILGSLPFTFMRWHFGLKGSDAETERQLEKLLVETIDGARELDGAVVLAFDAVHDRDGKIDLAGTHLYVTNDYVIELAARHPKNPVWGIGSSLSQGRRGRIGAVRRRRGGVGQMAANYAAVQSGRCCDVFRFTKPWRITGFRC